MTRQSPAATILYGLLVFIALSFTPVVVGAEDAMPWGSSELVDKAYDPQRVVYDVAVPNADALSGVLDRLSYLNTLYEADPFDAHIVAVLHGDEIPLFTGEHMEGNRELMERAQSLTQAGPIEFRMCAAAARGHGVEPEDVHGFVQVVPMADAEIVDLQNEGYAYMR
jgi:hypothetical protein